MAEAREKVVIEVEIDADISNDLAAIERRLKALEDRQRALSRASNEASRVNTEFERSTDRVDKKVNRTDNRMGRFSKTFGAFGTILSGVTSALKSFLTTFSKLSFIAIAGEVALFAAGLLAVKAALVTGKVAIQSYEVALKGLGIAAATVASGLALAAAAIQEFREVRLTPFFGGGAEGLVGARNLSRSLSAQTRALYGTESANEIIGALALAGVTRGNTIASQLFNISGGDTKVAQSLAAELAKARQSGSTERLMIALQGAMGFRQESISKDANLSTIMATVTSGGATSKRFQSLGEDIARTFIGTLQTEAQSFRMMFETIGEPLLGPFRDAFLQISKILREDMLSLSSALTRFGAESLAPSLVSIADSVSEFMRSNIINSIEDIAGTGERFIDFFKAIRDFFVSAGNWLQGYEEAANVVVDMFRAIFSASGGGLFRSFSDLLVENREAFIEFGSAIGNVVDAFKVQLGQGNQGFFAALPTLTQTLNVVATSVVPALGDIFAAIVPLFERFPEILRTLAEKVGPMLVRVFEGLKPVFDKLPAAIDDLTALFAAMEPVIMLLISAIDMLLAAIQSIPSLGGFGDFVSGLMTLGFTMAGIRGIALAKGAGRNFFRGRPLKEGLALGGGSAATAGGSAYVPKHARGAPTSGGAMGGVSFGSMFGGKPNVPPATVRMQGGRIAPFPGSGMTPSMTGITMTFPQPLTSRIGYAPGATSLYPAGPMSPYPRVSNIGYPLVYGPGATSLYPAGPMSPYPMSSRVRFKNAARGLYGAVKANPMKAAGFLGSGLAAVDVLAGINPFAGGLDPRNGDYSPEAFTFRGHYNRAVADPLGMGITTGFGASLLGPQAGFIAGGLTAGVGGASSIYQRGANVSNVLATIGGAAAVGAAVGSPLAGALVGAIAVGFTAYARSDRIKKNTDAMGKALLSGLEKSFDGALSDQEFSISQNLMQMGESAMMAGLTAEGFTEGDTRAMREFVLAAQSSGLLAGTEFETMAISEIHFDNFIRDVMPDLMEELGSGIEAEFRRRAREEERRQKILDDNVFNLSNSLGIAADDVKAFADVIKFDLGTAMTGEQRGAFGALFDLYNLPEIDRNRAFVPSVEGTAGFMQEIETRAMQSGLNLAELGANATSADVQDFLNAYTELEVARGVSPDVAGLSAILNFQRNIEQGNFSAELGRMFQPEQMLENLISEMGATYGMAPETITSIINSGMPYQQMLPAVESAIDQSAEFQRIVRAGMFGGSAEDQLSFFEMNADELMADSRFRKIIGEQTEGRRGRALSEEDISAKIARGDIDLPAAMRQLALEVGKPDDVTHGLLEDINLAVGQIAPTVVIDGKMVSERGGSYAFVVDIVVDDTRNSRGPGMTRPNT